MGCPLGVVMVFFVHVCVEQDCYFKANIFLLYFKFRISCFKTYSTDYAEGLILDNISFVENMVWSSAAILHPRQEVCTVTS